MLGSFEPSSSRPCCTRQSLALSKDQSRMSKIIGIDLGTTNSVVAVMEGGEPTVITNPSLDSDELKFFRRFLPTIDPTGRTP